MATNCLLICSLLMGCLKVMPSVHYFSASSSYLDFQFPRLNNVKIGYLLYADELVVLADSKSELQKAMNSVVSYCDSNNLVINASKTQYLVFHKGSLPRDSDVFLNGEKIPRTNSVQYLGFNFSSQLRFSAMLII